MKTTSVIMNSSSSNIPEESFREQPLSLSSVICAFDCLKIKNGTLDFDNDDGAKDFDLQPTLLFAEMGSDPSYSDQLPRMRMWTNTELVLLAIFVYFFALLALTIWLVCWQKWVIKVRQHGDDSECPNLNCRNDSPEGMDVERADNIMFCAADYCSSNMSDVIVNNNNCTVMKV